PAERAPRGGRVERGPQRGRRRSGAGPALRGGAPVGALGGDGRDAARKGRALPDRAARALRRTDRRARHALHRGSERQRDRAEELQGSLEALHGLMALLEVARQLLAGGLREARLVLISGMIDRDPQVRAGLTDQGAGGLAERELEVLNRRELIVRELALVEG